MAALAAAWRYTPLSEYVSPSRMIEWARAVRDTKWAPLAVMFIYTPATFVMFPRPLLTLLTVIAFGPWLGFVYGMAGILIAAMASYYAGRIMKQSTVERLAGDELMRVSKVLRNHGLLAVLAVRIVPAAPFVVEGIIAGAVRIRKWHFALGTFLGMLPGVLATTVFGDQIATALEDPSKISYCIVGLVVLVFAVPTWFLRRWFSKL
jgi:uncharacterized membrane protein YdjX (TVP38/TMEM64 family)